MEDIQIAYYLLVILIGFAALAIAVFWAIKTRESELRNFSIVYALFTLVLVLLVLMRLDVIRSSGRLVAERDPGEQCPVLVGAERIDELRRGEGGLALLASEDRRHDPRDPRSVELVRSDDRARVPACLGAAEQHGPLGTARLVGAAQRSEQGDDRSQPSERGGV